MADQLDPDYDYECFQCGKVFRRIVWGLSRAFERLEFGEHMNEIEVAGSEAIACYCSRECMELHVPRLMEQERVPIPDNPPGLGIIEKCAICRGPVLMTEFHLAYAKEVDEQVGKLEMQPLDVLTIAVLCNSCRPQRGAAVYEEPKVQAQPVATVASGEGVAECLEEASSALALTPMAVRLALRQPKTRFLAFSRTPQRTSANSVTGGGWSGLVQSAGRCHMSAKSHRSKSRTGSCPLVVASEGRMPSS